MIYCKSCDRQDWHGATKWLCWPCFGRAQQDLAAVGLGHKGASLETLAEWVDGKHRPGMWSRIVNATKGQGTDTQAGREPPPQQDKPESRGLFGWLKRGDKS